MESIQTSLKVLRADLSKVKDDALLVGFFKDKLNLSSELKKLDDEFNGIVTSCIKDSNFKGEKGEVKNIYVNKNIKNIVLVGLGEENKFNLNILSNIVGDVSKRMRDNGSSSFSIYLNSFGNRKLKNDELVEKIALSSLMGLYKFIEYKTKNEDKIKNIKQITIITDSNNSFEKELKYASIVAY